jgi:hypothetical protein
MTAWIAIFEVYWTMASGGTSLRSPRTSEPHPISVQHSHANAAHPKSVDARPAAITAWLASAAAFVGKRWPNLPPAQFQLGASTSVCRDRIAWLGRDFRTSAFNMALSNCGEGHVEADQNGRWPQIGVVAMEFPNCRALAAARAAVDHSRRSSFRLPIATVFRVVSRGRALIFVTSESVLRDDVGELLEGIESFAADQRECIERPRRSSP